MSSHLPATRHLINTVSGRHPRHELIEAPMVYPKGRELLIRVKAAGVNRADLAQSRGHYPPPPGAPDTLGLEIAGEVVAVGEEASLFRPGDRVMALLQGGGYATYASAPEETTLPIPEGLSWTDAAAIPEAWFTVWHNLIRIGGLKSDQTVLIHGGSSGIGTAAIQIAKTFGARVITTVRNEIKAQAVSELGADRAILYPKEDFTKAVLESTAGAGVDLILDLVGADYLEQNLRAMKQGGRLILINSQSGEWGRINLMRLITGHLTITGSTLRPLPLEEKSEIRQEIQSRLLPLLASGRLMPKVHACFPLEAVEKAHALMHSSEHIGKIILIP